MNTEEFIKQALEKHGNKVDYSKVVYVNNSRRVKIICPEHGEFEQFPKVHLRSKNACPKCARKAVAEKLSMTTEQFIEKAREIHGDVYDYSKSVYVRSSRKITITCPLHGDFEMTPNNHLSGQKCRSCAFQEVSGNFRLTTGEFIARSRELHGDQYSYEKTVYGRNAHEKVVITCVSHGDFEQSPNKHLHSEHGCPRCLHKSKPQDALTEFISTLGVTFTENDREVIPPYELDICIPEFNIAIEVNGLYWHSSKFKDKNYHWNKEIACRKKGINLLQFWDIEIGDLVFSMIKSKLGMTERVYARKTKVVDLPREVYRGFLRDNHLQGEINSRVRKGLVYNGDLVSVMGMSRGHIDRYASKQGLTVVGGFSKLLNQFDDEDIISFSSNRYSDGSVYAANGFTLEKENKHTLHYTDGSILYPRQKFQRHKLVGIQKGESVEEFLNKQGIYSIYGSGTKKWRLKR